MFITNNKQIGCMQEKKKRTPNAERSAQMRHVLVDAARALFAERGYAATGTPEIVAAAQVTRGALYHHFADKAALFLAVVEAEQAVVMAEIELHAAAVTDPIGSIISGGEAFLAAMEVQGRHRILLLDAPAVFDRATLDAVEDEAGRKVLAEAITKAQAEDRFPEGDPAIYADLANALYDRAALSIAAEPEGPTRSQISLRYRKALAALWTTLATG